MSAATSATPVVAAPATPGQEHPGCLPKGYRLREFVIERVLGDGGFGVVYSALDLRLERRVAIKEYMPSSLARRDADYSVQMLTSARHRNAFEVGLRSFINEARLLARFEHPALLKVHQFWQEKGTAYMVMPYHNAPTLRTWVRSRTEPVDEAWLRAFLLSAMEALEVMHAEACLHRDIAPDNILVLKDAAPLLLDFGAARRVIGDLRKALTVIVKPGFAPLEQYADTVKMKQGPWTDVYALAAVAHFAITGHAPAPAVSRVLADEVVPLRVRARGRYSDALLGAIDTALAVKPERRPQTIAAFRALLQSDRKDEWLPTQFIGRTSSAARKSRPAMAVPATGSFDASVDGSETRAPARKPEQVAPRTPSPATIERRMVAPRMAEPATLDRETAAPRTKAQGSTMRSLHKTISTNAATVAAARAPVSRLRSGLTSITAITSAIADTIPPSVRASRWMTFAGYAAMALACAGTLALTMHFVEQYVEANTGPRAPVTRSVPAPAVEPAQASVPAPASAPQSDATDAVVAARPAEFTLAPAAIAPQPGPTAAPARAPGAPAIGAAAPSSPKAKPAPRTTVSEIEHEPEPAAAILLTSAARPQGADPARPVKSRGLDGVLVPLERAAEIAQVAPVQLVVAAPSEPTKQAPLRPIVRPQPQFPAAAAADGVRKGRVLAQLAINADGSIGRVEILESQPRKVFDEEVLRALVDWRYEAPGQARQTKVEFVFRMD